MNPQIARALAVQHQNELAAQAARCRRVPSLLPRWNVSWFRAREQRGSSVMIIISAHRPA